MLSLLTPFRESFPRLRWMEARFILKFLRCCCVEVHHNSITDVFLRGALFTETPDEERLPSAALAREHLLRTDDDRYTTVFCSTCFRRVRLERVCIAEPTSIDPVFGKEAGSFLLKPVPNGKRPFF